MLKLLSLRLKAQADMTLHVRMLHGKQDCSNFIGNGNGTNRVGSYRISVTKNIIFPSFVSISKLLSFIIINSGSPLRESPCTYRCSFSRTDKDRKEKDNSCSGRHSNQISSEYKSCAIVVNQFYMWNVSTSYFSRWTQCCYPTHLITVTPIINPPATPIISTPILYYNGTLDLLSPFPSSFGSYDKAMIGFTNVTSGHKRSQQHVLKINRYHWQKAKTCMPH
jgi:hypothetical protein